uniref:Uncharacterized protein n=1 Tax=Anguilla anguilla TaxID=7936 RepID=A0A0E9PC74_ANGAN
MSIMPSNISLIFSSYLLSRGRNEQLLHSV